MSRRLVLIILTVTLVALLAMCSKERETPSPTATPPETATTTPTAEAPTPTNTPRPAPTPLDVSPDAALALDALLPQETLTLRFNQPMDSDSSAQPLVLAPFVAGEAQWDPDRTSLTFIPADGFDPGRAYLVTLDQALTTATGHEVGRDWWWNLQVLPAPTIVERTPTARRLEERRPTIELRFSQEMNRDSVAAAIKVEPAIPLELRWQDRTLSITPAEPLAPGTAYDFSLSTLAADTLGVQLEKEARWSYRPNDLIAYATTPEGRDRDNPVTIRFNYAMDTDSVNAALEVEQVGDQAGATVPVVGNLRWDRQGQVATFSPAAPLASGAEYVIRLAGSVRDSNGDPIEPAEPIHFTTPPPIVAVSPEAIGVNPATTIRVTFDRLMSEQVTGAAFVLTPETSGSLRWSETTLIFEPAAGYFYENTPYTVTITTEALDATGKAILDEPYSWSFETSQLESVARFGEGPNAQVLDANGRRAVQFHMYQSIRITLNFELYRLSLEQFLDRYSSGFRGVAGWEKRLISTEGASPAKRWQIETTTSSNRFMHIQDVLIPDDVPPGLYILNMGTEYVNDQLILILTANTLMVKQAEGQLVAWLTDINGGALPGREISVYARDGELISSGQADQQGVFRTEVARDPQPLIVVARDGDDVTATGLSNEWRGYGGWWGWWAPQPTAQRFAVYIYTDRPIYRPGQTVYFKAIVRQDDDAVLDILSAGTPVTARIRDARDNVVQTLNLKTNHFGTVSAKFQLAEGAMLGDYAVEIMVDKESHRQVFKVEDYRKPDYQVTLTTDDARYIEGETIEVTIDSRYFFGEPVPNADLVINRFVLGERDWWIEGGEDYVWFQSYLEPITARTDADGRFTVSLDAELGHHTRSIYWSSSLVESVWAIEATVDDGSHQTVSGFATYRVFNAAEQLRLDIGGYAKEPGTPFTVKVEALTIDDEGVSGRELQLRLLRYSRESHGYDIVIQSVNLTSGGDGTVRTPFTIEEPGFYRLELSGRDRLGNEISYTSWVYAFSEISARWYGRGDGLTIDADKISYASGETAHLLIESTFSGPALLTFERGTTRREQLVELNAPLTLVEVAIQEDDAPNIFVTVNAWEEAGHHPRPRTPGRVCLTANCTPPASS